MPHPRRHPNPRPHPWAWPTLAAVAAAALAGGLSSSGRMPGARPPSSFFAAAQQVHVPRPDKAWAAGVAAVLPPTLEVRRAKWGGEGEAAARF